MSTIAILGTMDTKGVEHGYVADLIKQRGHQVLVIDVGTVGEPRLKPDITRGEVAAAAGVDFAALAARQDRGESVTVMSRGAPVVLAKLAEAKRIDGVISLGGGGGTAIATAAMRALPVGFPKLMVSTLASGNVAPYVGVKDIVMFPSVVDVAGLNRLSRQLLARAAGAICGMVETQPPATTDKPLIVASQFGNTTPCIEHAKKILEAAGYEVIVFAATGTGGRTMESLIESGLVAGVLDITTTEWADELVGGVLTAGPTRLEAAARCGVPAVVSTGCLDMVNFGPPETVPAKFAGRKFYQHNPQVTLMRTTPEECTKLGNILAEKLNRSTGPVAVLLPLRGGSMISAPGGPFSDSAADAALYSSLKQSLRTDIVVQELDAAINDPAFAEVGARALLDLLRPS
ncbi:MAG TPA: Tm-1-like ATP-binding domain-containing protein [Verrucomicrobiota bacterium]|nr:Tm-1-like ATP-binding domain-containing protein [Verrucomicrobiota bacterium]HNT15177.1 Tm-1-like ATP-binding domain-containing protein [Verrucomicrobiota bacterium]